jgi:hypothetical protein
MPVLTSMRIKVKKVVVAIDEDYREALYVDGKLRCADGSTIYASDIADAVGSGLMRFEHRGVKTEFEWPNDLAKLRRMS